MPLVTKKIKNKFNNYKLLSSFFLCLTPILIIYYCCDGRSKKKSRYGKDPGKGIFIIAHVMIINGLFFYGILTPLSEYLKIVFRELKIGISNQLLMLFISSLIMSSVTFVVGMVSHAIVLRNRGIPIRDWAATDDLENEILCTGLITLFCTLVLRLYSKLCDFKHDLQNRKLKAVSMKEKTCFSSTILRVSESHFIDTSESITKKNIEDIKLKLRILKRKFIEMKRRFTNLKSLIESIESVDPLDPNMQRINLGLLTLQKQFMQLETSLKDLVKVKNNMQIIHDTRLLKKSILQLNQGCSTYFEKDIIMRCTMDHVESMYNTFIRTEDSETVVENCHEKSSQIQSIK